MTAPYRRASPERTMGNTHARVKKLENEDRLATTGDWAELNAFPCTMFEDDGSCPTPVFFNHTGTLVQQSIVHCITVLGVFGGALFDPGTGTVFLAKLLIPYDINNMAPYLVEPLTSLGVGWARDDSADLQVPIYFVISNLFPPGDPTGQYIEARVLSDGSSVGPGNPFTWTTGDIMWSGTFSYVADVPEQVVAAYP